MPPADSREYELLHSRLVTFVFCTSIAVAVVITLCVFVWSLCRTPTPLSTNRATAVPTDDPATAVDISSLPVFVNRVLESAEGAKLDCPVCLTEFREGEQGLLLPGCAHKFHAECVAQWLQSNFTCPLCRSPVNLFVDGSLPAL